MIDHTTLVSMMSSYGLWVLTPLAVIEGPIVTVIAGYLVSLSILSLWQVIVCVIVADILGDCMLYFVGRLALGSLSPTWRDRLGLSRRRMFSLMRGFRRHGTRILVAAKLTHAAGFAALTAAGAARMPFAAFLIANTLAGIPKCLFFVALGYLFGNAYETIGSWLSGEAAILLALLTLGAVAIIYLQRRKASR
ncbi:DedA family protein [Pleomorphomonas sp. PLEO]|uniref:DedA family protein n=1 Tax=Pleomorphomonas sp. PLEO TaxID=3239306 RepID=UPI00351DE094